MRWAVPLSRLHAAARSDSRQPISPRMASTRSSLMLRARLWVPEGMSIDRFSRRFHNGRMDEPDLPPAARTLLQQAARRETPCGDGVMAWHLWGAGEPVVMLHG